jgi:predicted RNA binding protein YcfA (HicA-like mRNA interferase family)
MDLEKIIRAAKDQGWEVRRTEKSHWSFTNPEGATFITSGTPSDVRSGRFGASGS